ncbi:MAG: dipeptidase [Acidobacteria bacterium]|nr:dipeptidase [Acidobacteriota bacterium]
MNTLYSRKFLIFLLFVFVALNIFADEDKTIDPLWKKAMEIHQRAIVIDSHVDTPLAFSRGVNIGVRDDSVEVDLVKMKEGGVDAAFFAVFISNDDDDKHPSKDALQIIDRIYKQVEKNSDKAEMAFSVADIERIEKSGKRAILIGMENGSPVEDSLELLRIYYRLGVRYVTLTHNYHNSISDSSTAFHGKWYGLSPFGVDMVKEMNRLGMMIDVSHISDRAFYEVLKYSTSPVIATHSCCRAICDVNRNMSDEMIKELAKHGGVIQINFYSGFLSPEFKAKSDENYEEVIPSVKEIRSKYRDDKDAYWDHMVKIWKESSPESPEIDILMNHIDHVVKLVGVDHVGLGSDFDGAGNFPKGLQDISGYPVITYNLLKRGYSEEDILKILGGNLLRVFRENEKQRTE